MLKCGKCREDLLDFTVLRVTRNHRSLVAN